MKKRDVAVKEERREVLEWERQIHCQGGGEMRVSWPRAGQIPNSRIWEWIPTLPFRDLQITSERNYLSKSIKHSMICNSQCSGLAHSHYPPPPK